MVSYAILVSPAVNRVYGQDAPRLSAAELGVLNHTLLDHRLHDIGHVAIAGVDYLRFLAQELTGDDLAVVASLSTAQALFEVTAAGLLQPVELPSAAKLPGDLVTIQRYQGKTNEQFTKLLLNVTLACAGVAPGTYARVLDPVAGRGTTLNHALVAGLDASGIEVERAHFDAYTAFLKTWLRDKRFKHRVEQTVATRPGRSARVVDVEFAPSKDDMKAGAAQRVRWVNDDARRAGDHFKQRSLDAVCGDLPYGVQHAGRAGSGRHGPAELLRDALAGWVKLLRPGGTAGFSWNRRSLPRDDMQSILESAGLRIPDIAPLDRFEHRVDHAITRDLAVGVRP